MTLAIIGQGNMGKGLAARLQGKTDVVTAGRADAAGAIKAADVVVLAVPYEAALELASAHDFAGKIIVDITNALKPDFSGITVGFDTSAAEEIQTRAKGARVVKAYNTIFADHFARPEATTANVPVFLAGNDEAAVAEVAEIVRLSGFRPELTGSLDAARLIEPMAMLNIRLGYGLGKGTGIAPAWLEAA